MNRDTSDIALSAILATLAVLLVVTCGRTVSAAEPCPSGEPTKVEQPCEGWALSKADVLFFAGLRVDLRECRKLRDADKLEAAAADKLAADKLAASAERIQTLETLLDDASQIHSVPRPWHEEPAFVAIVSALAVGVVSALAVVLAYEVD